LGDAFGIATVLNNLRSLAHVQHDYELARSLYEESLPIKHKLGDKRGVEVSMLNLGKLAFSDGQLIGATGIFAKNLTLSWKMRDKKHLTDNLKGLALTAMSMGQLERAAHLLGAAKALSESVGYVMDPDDLAEYERAIDAVRSELGKVAWEKAWQEGRAMELEQVVAYALEETEAGVS
jgi:non-specific serine/threonine protein kinase